MIFFQCLENCQKQASFSSAQLLSLEELERQGVLEGITVPVSTVGGIDPKTALFKNDVYIYAKIKGSAIPQPIEAIPQKLTTQETRDTQVSVGDRLFYSTVRVVQDAETITTIFGESFSIKVSKNNRTVKINYKSSDKLRTLIVDLDFLISYIEAGSFQWGGVDVPFDYKGANFSNFKLEEEKSRLEYAKKIVALLELLGCKKDLSIKSLKDKDWKHISYLVTALVDKEPVEHLRTDLPPIMTIDIGELKFIVCLRKIEGKDGTYSIFDFFKTEMSLVYENEAGEKLPISQYVILHADDLIKADNIRYDVLLPSFQNTAQHEETIIRSNFFLLELLEAYDKANSRTEFLSVARSFSDWIFASNDGSLPYDVKLLNKLQIEKRERALTIDEVNPLNENFSKREFQALWREINHKYAYTVDFDSAELIRNAIAHIDEKLFVSELQYTTTIGRQKTEMNEYEIERGASFTGEKTRTQTLKHAETSQIKYDLIGKIAEGTALTRRTVSAILQGIRVDKLYMFKNNPEEFITKVIRLINEQKATMIVEHISYDTIVGEYDSSIFTAEKATQSFDKAFLAKKAIQDYVFTDGFADKSIEREFAEDLDAADEVCVYAKLPRTFQIPTPVGNYSPDWAIAFYEGTVKHIFFIAETKGTMESL